MAIGFIEPLAIDTILINIFAGSPEIFMAIAFIVIAMMAAKWRMPNIAYLVVFASFMFLIVPQVAGGVFLTMVGLIGAVMIGLTIVRAMRD